MDGLSALFPTAAMVVPFYHSIHAEQIHKQNLDRFQYQRYFIQHFNTARFPMRLPLLDKGENSKGETHDDYCNDMDYNYKFENPTYKVKNCIS